MAAVAQRQHGVVTRAQLTSAGMTPQEIRSRIAEGALIRIHRGVFRVGHAAPSSLAQYTAAVLACGERAALAGFAAAHLHRIAKAVPSVICVLAPTQRNVGGVRTIRSRVFSEAEVVTVSGIRVTSVARTLVDVAPLVPFAALVRLCHEARVLYETAPQDTAIVLERRPNAPAAAALRRAMSGDEVQLSVLETRFVRLLRRKRLPLPMTNQETDRRLVDCRWPDRRLTVELDSFRFHSSRHSWEQDRLREREAYARGDQFRRYTWRDVTEEPRAMLRELRSLLS